MRDRIGNKYCPKYIFIILVTRLVSFVGIHAIFLLLFSLLITPSQLLAWTPPAGSPMANGVHPRLYLISDAYKSANPGAMGMTVTEIRQKLVNDLTYLSRFNDLIASVDGEWSKTVTSTLGLDASRNAINNAFLYIIDVDVLKAPPYNLSISPAHTSAEYGNKAVEYGRYIAVKLNAVSATTTSKHDWLDFYTYDYGSTGYDGPKNLALAIVNDWVFSKVTKSDRQDFIRATKNAYDNKYAGTKDNPFTEQSYGTYQNGMAVLGLYGDDVNDTGSTFYSDTLVSLMDLLKRNWIDGFVTLHNNFFLGGVSTVEGIGYQQISYKKVADFLPAMSTALNTNYYEQTGWMKYTPFYYLYSINPRRFVDGDEHRWLQSQDSSAKDPSWDYKRDWGRVTRMVMNPTIHFLARGNQSDSGDLASLFKWIRDDSNWLNGSDSPTSAANIQQRWVPFELISTDRHDNVISKSPSTLNLPLSKNIGNGRHYFLSAFDDQDATVVKFEAPSWFNGSGGHNHKTFGAFEIYKYGHLTTNRNIKKSFSGTGSKKTDSNPWYNVIGVRSQAEIDSNPSTNYYAEFRSNFNQYEIDPNAAAWQTNGSNHSGTILLSDLNASKYDYVDYDYSNAWSDSKVDYAKRQFVNLRSAGGSNDEYVVVFDRVNTPNASDTTKYWFLQVQYDAPKLLNSVGTEISMTAQDYADDPDSGGGRWVRTDSTPTQNNIIELNASWSGNNGHGRLYNKTLLPTSFQINKTGGSGHYWEDMRGRLMLTRALADWEKYYRGTYTMQVQSTTGQQSDTFLNVMQIGDSATLTSMTPSTRIDGDTMVGTQINDATVPRIVMFSSNTLGASVASATYSVSYPSSKSGRHLLVDMTPGLYDIYKGGSKIFSNLTASASAGTLSFDATGSATFQVVRSGNLPPDLPPDAPTGVLVN